MKGLKRLGATKETKKEKIAATTTGISAPKNLVHQVHVDNEFNWTGNQDPKYMFEILYILGQGAFGCVYKAKVYFL